MNYLKNGGKAEAFRYTGNQFYSQKNFFDALVNYNQSLCMAPENSEHLGLAFANRSAVYFEMKLYDECLKNIELARRYPIKNYDTLKKREEKCTARLMHSKKMTNPWEFFKLSHEPHENLSSVCKCLELRDNDQFGKHIVTNKNLEVGDILVIEAPFISVLISESVFLEVDSSNKFQHCANCLQDKNLDLIPCEKCCDAMFCSDKCRNEAFNIHKYECPVMNKITKSGSVHIALKIFFLSLSFFNDDLQALQNFMKETEEKAYTIGDLIGGTTYDFDFDDEKYQEVRKYYLMCLNSLKRSKTMFSLQQHLAILDNHPLSTKAWDNNLPFIQKFLQSQCQVNDHYFHGIFQSSLAKKKDMKSQDIRKSFQKVLGTGWFAFCSMINHSCSPNVMRIYVEGKVVIVVCRPIFKGGQLFDCYKANFNMQGKSERQDRLLKEFDFNCHCEACTENYPAPPALLYKDIKILKLAKRIEEEFSKPRAFEKKKQYKLCCEVLQNHNKNYPCLELSLMQKNLASFLMNQAKPYMF